MSACDIVQLASYLISVASIFMSLHTIQEQRHVERRLNELRAEVERLERKRVA